MGVFRGTRPPPTKGSDISLHAPAYEVIIFSFLHHHYIWKKCTVGFLDNKWVNEIFLTHKSNVPKISARLCCVKSIKLAKIMNFLKRKSPKRSSALFRMKVNKVSRFFLFNMLPTKLGLCEFFKHQIVYAKYLMAYFRGK